jgi:hypothetical protein
MALVRGEMTVEAGDSRTSARIDPLDVPGVGGRRAGAEVRSPGETTEAAPAPQAAGLLTDFVPFDLAALEAGLQQFGGQLRGAGSQPHGLLFWAGVSCWAVAAAAVAHEVARWRQAKAHLAADGPLHLPLDGALLPREDA